MMNLSPWLGGPEHRRGPALAIASRGCSWALARGFLALYLTLPACSVDLGKLRALAHDGSVHQVDTPADVAAPPWDLDASGLSARDVPGTDLEHGDEAGTGPIDTAPHDSQADAESSTPDVPPPPDAALDAGAPDARTDDVSDPGVQDGAIVDPVDAGAGQDVGQAIDAADASDPNADMDATVPGDAVDASVTNDGMFANDAGDLGNRDALLPATFEATSLTKTASTIGAESNSDYGGGCPTTPCQYVQFTSGRTPSRGDWIEFTLPSLDAGSYSLGLDYKSAYNRGIVQVSLDGVNLAVTCDLYSLDFIYDAHCSLGTVTVPTSGPHLLRLTVTSKNSQSGGYVITAERFIFTPI
jgi:hypothetical protein